jgi:hypothetical protein
MEKMNVRKNEHHVLRRFPDLGLDSGQGRGANSPLPPTNEFRTLLRTLRHFVNSSCRDGRRLDMRTTFALEQSAVCRLPAAYAE